MVEVGAQFFNGDFAITVRQLRSVLQRYELAYAAEQDIYLYPFSREGDHEGAFHDVLHDQGWVGHGDIVMAWVSSPHHGVPTVRPTWPVEDDDAGSTN